MDELRLHQTQLLANSVRTQCKRALKSTGRKRCNHVELALRCAKTLDTTIRRESI